MTAILAILSKIWGFITSKAGEWVGISAGILTALALVRKSGADAVRTSDMKETLKDVEVKNAIDNNNANVDAVSILHDKWQK